MIKQGLLIGIGLLLGLWSVPGCNTPSQASAPLVHVPTPPPVPDLNMLQERLSLLLHHESLHEFVQIDSSGITFYATAADRAAQQPETKIWADEYELTARLFEMMRPDSMTRYYLEKGTERWGDEWRALARHASPVLPGPAAESHQQPLAGWRIALDPGHIAGDEEMANIEGKYVKMHPSRLTNFDRINFWEANLTLATAYLIREQLMAKGATVMMTRYTPGQSVEGETYFEWKEANWPQAVHDSAESWELTPYQQRYWLERAKDPEIMRAFYTAEDLRNRAKNINAFHPHLSLIIHYNVHGPNWENRDRGGFIPPADTNYLMAFIPGGFLAKELATPEDRAVLLRLLLTHDLTYSQELAEAFVDASVRLTGVPVIPPDHQLAYLHHSSIYAGSPGVYARNLSLTRLIKGPLVYGESLNQDFRTEAIQLNKRDLEIEGLQVSSRVQDIADAYVAAVMAFALDERF